MAFALECDYELHVDAHWFQGNVACQQKWSDNGLALKANPLYNFGIQVPFQANLSPACALSKHVEMDKKIVYQILVQALIIYFLFIAILKRFSVEPIACEIMSVFASFLLWIPSLTNNALTAQITLGLYWQEIAIHNLFAFYLLQSALHAQKRASITGYLFLLAALLTYSVLAFPMFAPHLFITHACAVAALLLAGNKTTRKTILLFYLCFGIVFIILRIPSFLHALFTYTREGFFPGQSNIARSDCLNNPLWLIRRTSIFLYPGIGNALASLIALACLCFVGWCLKTKALYANLGLYLAGAWTAGTLYNIKWLLLGGPPAAGFYFELVNAPLFALIALTSCYCLFRTMQGVPARFIYVGLVVLCYFLFIVKIQKTSKQTHFSKWPPSESNWLKEICRNSQIGESGAFRGKCLVLLNTKSQEKSGWGPFYNICANKIRQKIGNDLTIDLMNSDVPFYNEHGHFISPSMLCLLCASFYDPKDDIDRAARAPRVFNKTMAQLLGVTTIIADSPISGAELVLREGFDGHEIFLYKLIDANLGGFSPTSFEIYKNIAEFTRTIRGSQTDFRKTALVEAPIAGPLLPASLKELCFEKGPEIRIEAQSEGQSLLVLPLDFSYCLQFAGSGNPKIIPVNLSCTGLLFDRKLKGRIKFKFSPFDNLKNRKKDIERCQGLGIPSMAPGLLFSPP
jgi:hypothetical protein